MINSSFIVAMHFSINITLFMNYILHSILHRKCIKIYLHFLHSCRLFILIFSNVADTYSVHVEQEQQYCVDQDWYRCDYGIPTVRIVAPIEVLCCTYAKEYATAVSIFKITSRAYIERCFPVIKRYRYANCTQREK